MAQNFTRDCFGAGHIAGNDMQAIENNFACLRSMFSGPTAPSNPASGYMWFATVDRNLRIRNGSNSAWVGVLAIDAPDSTLIYRNDTDDGWAISATSTDTVAAVKSQSGAYISGGSQLGSWAFWNFLVTQHNHATSHTHDISGGVHTHGLAGGGYIGRVEGESNTKSHFTNNDGDHSHSLNIYSSIYNAGVQVSGGSSWRPAAIVCTMQHLDI